MFKRYKKGIKDFVYGKENIKENANVIQIYNIQYRFRNKDEQSPLYGEYSDKISFTTNDDIRIGPGITLLSGASGAGKSTLITLLNHGDHVTEGAIRIGTTNEKIIYCEDIDTTIMDADALIIVTEWDQFKKINLDVVSKLMHGNIIIDGRNILDRENVEKLEFIYKCIGA